MHALLAPVFAQVLTFGLGDRVDGNYIVDPTGAYFESKNTTTGLAAVKLDWQRGSMNLGYAPIFTIVPLGKERNPIPGESTGREYLLYQQAFLGGTYRWRQATLTVTQGAGYGDRDFQREALMPNQAPLNANTAQQPPNQTGQPPANTNPPGGPGTSGTGTSGTGTGGSGTPPAGSTGTPSGGTPAGQTPHALPTGPERYGAFKTTATFENIASRAVTWRIAAGYWVGGGMTDQAQKSYPLVRGPDVGAGLRYSLDGQDDLTTIATAQYVSSNDGSSALLSLLTEDYTHRYTRHTSVTVGAGGSFSRSEVGDGYLNRLPLYAIYPTARAGMTHTDRVANGMLMLNLGASTAPVVDLATASVDPRVGGNVMVTWSKRKLTLSANGMATVSIAKQNTTAFDFVTGTLSAHYDFGAGFGFDGGVRNVWQRYGNVTYIAPSVVFFAGVSWNGVTSTD